MRDHWWWRPGWRVGRRMYAIHTTFEGQDGLHDLVRAYQEPLRALPGLDIIPLDWLHLTMQGVGFTDEVDDVETIAKAVQRRLAPINPVDLTFDRPILDPEAPQFRPHPVEGINRVRRAVQQGIIDVRGEVNESDSWTPHMSIAYSNFDGPAEPYREALNSAAAAPVTITVRKIKLLVLGRDEHLYRWEIFAGLTLGTL
ncbi:2'-5' RNA ligase family protein [Microtetraspora malaysiensis]|uniref:2'-5' RNA ligase family protein n=1 Tax=Microtetraspora malaysiensis TaxID=161358 RepID=UPI003D91AD97